MSASQAADVPTSGDAGAAPRESPVPEELLPAEGEVGTLSALLVQRDGGWCVASASLLAVDRALGYTSWKRWAEVQPATRGARYDEGGFDLGPVFAVEPFAGLRALRQVLTSDAVDELLDNIQTGVLTTPWGPADLEVTGWSSTVFLSRGSTVPAAEVVVGARRPMPAVIAELRQETPRESNATWEWPLPPGMQPGPDLGRIAPHRKLLHWPEHLLGMRWLGDRRFEPTPALVVGRPANVAWIADVTPEFEDGNLVISVCWDETRIDPLTCSVLYRCEHNGLPLFARQLRITELPGYEEQEGPGRLARSQRADQQPHEVSWQRRVLNLRIPRGPRRTEWSVQLLGPDGVLLDERPIAKRVESLHFSLNIMPGGGTASEFVVGDREDPPTAQQRDDAIKAAAALDQAARQAAAGRRLSDGGQLAEYLSWRFSCRAGELLVIDPFLLGKKTITDGAARLIVEFLAKLRRPVRALAGAVSPNAAALLASHPHLDVRKLGSGSSSVHDRVWIVGDTGLLVGGSLNGILNAATKQARTSTVAELAYQDSLMWRARFEELWAQARLADTKK